jgi:hypothetical protein
MLNSNLMEVLAREQLELAILYSGNPCQLGFVHALGIPFVIFDLDGLSDETLISADSQWDFDHAEAKFQRDYSVWDLVCCAGGIFALLSLLLLLSFSSQFSPFFWPAFLAHFPSSVNPLPNRVSPFWHPHFPAVSIFWTIQFGFNSKWIRN